MIQVHDNWHPSPNILRTFALAGEFVTLMQGGARFPGFQASETDPWPALGKVMGFPVEGKEAFRIYLKGQTQPTTIHQDAAMSEYSAILYLDKREQGSTAFYRTKGLLPEEFEMTAIVKSVFNRLVVFNSDLWHSRYPLDEITTGTTPETGRLIQVFFFHPLVK